jgi:hydroxymethylglutaryl-CoA synthase
MQSFGIEKITVYPSSLFLNLEDLAAHKGYDLDNLRNALMVKERSVVPTWEDAVTMAVNAVEQLQLTDEDRQSINLLIVGTETGVDHEKSISSWVHSFCKLPSHCRNFELKSACYAGTAALRMAIFSLMAQEKGSKALVVTTDMSLIGIGEPYEYILGGGATALLLSDQAEFLKISHDQAGVYAHEVTDVIRPLPWLETGDSELSLLSYIDSLYGAYESFISLSGTEQGFNERFDFNVYHMPFAGISYRAHKAMLQVRGRSTRSEIEESFSRKVKPSLMYPQRIGGTYGGCVFTALLSLVANAHNISPGQKVGIFSYGSGSCAEYYTAIVGERARQIAESAGIDKLLDHRLALTVAAYEAIERQRVEQIKGGNFVPDLTFPKHCYESQYRGKKRLVLRVIENYYRHYVWS